MFSLSNILLLGLSTLAHTATVTYDFNITWVTANPDGRFPRPTIGINDQWPLPYIAATVGDRVIVNVLNLLGNQTTSLHFHGLYMNGTTEMDGSVGVSQCAIPIGGSFTYNFTVDQPGTYWYHSHETAQYPDGLRGPFIVNDPDSPYKGNYEEERVLTVSDWYHDQITQLMKSFMSVTNPRGAEPIPEAALLNDTQNLTTAVKPGKTYMFRIINMGAFAGQYIWFEGHTMQIIEVDGIYTEAAAADMIYLTAAQRYSVLITTKNQTSTNFAYVASMDKDLFDKSPATLNPNVTGWLVYNSAAELPKPALLDSFDPFDDFTLVPIDGEPLLPEPDYSVPLTVEMISLGDGANYASFNGISYTRPKVPSLYTALSTGLAANNATIYAPNTNAFVLQKNQVIDIVLNNNDPGKHPFHLHGHTFQAIARSRDDAGDYVANIFLWSRIWLFHCHVEWHVASGLVATIIEAPTFLQKTLTIPQDHLAACAAQDVPIAGNAAGNTKDLFDLKGANKSPPPLPAGFTVRGTVAMVFSCLSAFLGIAVIAWYGAGEIGTKQPSKKTKEAVELVETESEK